MLQEFHLGVLNDLVNVDCKIEVETRTQLQKFVGRVQQPQKDYKNKRRFIMHALRLLSSVLPKWISSKIFSINLIIFRKCQKEI